MTNIQYSQKEQELFTALGYKDLLTQEPTVLYRMVALNLFKENSYTKEFLIESVRRCLNAIDNGTPYRLTPEFDELILLDGW
jgi:hypothetical protein